MRILDKHIIKEFLRYYFPFAFFFIAIFILTDFFTSMAHFKKEVSFFEIGIYYLLQIPFLLVVLSPLSVIISGLFVTSFFSSTNQFQAMQVSGISGKRTLLPLLTTGLVIGFLLLFIDNTVVYKVNHLSYRLKEKIFTGIIEAKVQRNIFVAVPPDYLFYARSLNSQKGIMTDILIYKNSEPPVLICAREAKWKGNFWTLSRGNRYTLLNEDIKEQTFNEKVIPVNKNPGYFTRKYFPPERMNIQELSTYISEYSRGGFKTEDLETELQFKISSPFSNFILMLLALPLGVILKRGGKGASLAVGLLMSFGYFELTAFFKALGKGGVLNPLTTAWLANLLFAIVGTYLIYKME